MCFVVAFNCHHCITVQLVEPVCLWWQRICLMLPASFLSRNGGVSFLLSNAELFCYIAFLGMKLTIIMYRIAENALGNVVCSLYNMFRGKTISGRSSDGASLR